jgi:hypothetical protein
MCVYVRFECVECLNVYVASLCVRLCGCVVVCQCICACELCFVCWTIYYLRSCVYVGGGGVESSSVATWQDGVGVGTQVQIFCVTFFFWSNFRIP